MMATIPVNNLFIFQINPISLKPLIPNPRGRRTYTCDFDIRNRNLQFINSRNCFVICRVTGAGGDDSGAAPLSTVSDANSAFRSLSSTSESYVPVLVRMLGLDNDVRGREQAVMALWKYSLGGKNYVDNIMKFRGSVNLIVNLLTSESTRACEAAAGLLAMISSVNSYRDIVAESGAIEETTALLRRPSLTSEVKEQSLCMLWNLSADEALRLKLANPSLLPLLVKYLDEEDVKIIEAVGGVLANLALNTYHKIMVEVGVIPKLAKFLTCETEASKVIRKESRNALLELAKDDYYKILIMEEGLVLVPLVGAAAYASFKPALHSWPSLPDGTELTRSSKGSSRYGASELLLGLNVEDNTDKMDKIKMDAIIGRTHQQFLARIGAIESGDERKPNAEFSTSFHHTLLLWRDGIARLVLILELEDEVAIARAADAIAAASINETIRISFKEAGAVQRLVYLLRHNSAAVQSAVVNALEKLSVSNRLCETMEFVGVTQILIDMLKDSETSGASLEKTLSILSRICDPNKQMKFKFYDGSVNGSRESTDSENGNDAPLSTRKMVDTKHLLDSALVTRLATMLKTGSSSLQAKIASVLEYITMIEPCMDTVIATHMESGLLAVFQQNFPKALFTDVAQYSIICTFVGAGLQLLWRSVGILMKWIAIFHQLQAKFLTCETEASKVIRKESRNALLELAKDDYYKILIMEEGLVLVPLVGAAAYASFKPALHSWPSLPDGTELTRSSKGSSRYGASELLLGLNVEDNTDKMDKIKMDAIIGRTHQQFLARIGAIESGDERKPNAEFSTSFHHTLLLWRDGIARLVLILELEDEVAIARAADAITAASINETIRISFKEAGAVQRLVYLLRHNSAAVQSAVVNALEKLSVSNRLCETMEFVGVTQILIDMLKDSETSGASLEKTLSILSRICDPNKQMKFKFYDGSVNGSRESTDSENGNDAPLSTRKMVDTKHLLDSALVTRLATMLKTGSSSLQAKIASVLEYITMIEPCMDTVIATHMESGLLAVFQQNFPKDMEDDVTQEPDPAFLEEGGLTISAASRLLTKLVDYPQFRDTINLDHFTYLLRKILKSEIPLHHKDWVAACLVRLSSFSTPFENSITTEVTLYETIPLLIEQIKTSSAERQEAAVVQLNRIISESVEGTLQAIASYGGIYPVVKVIAEGSNRAVAAGIAILYNLSMDSENHPAILAAGAVPVLTRIVRSETSHTMRAFRLLRNLPV